MVAQQTTSTDSFDDAMKATYTPPSRRIFGQVAVDTFPCTFEKNNEEKMVKVLFDAGRHSQDSKRTSVNITITPLPGSPAKFDTNRDMLAESKEWAQITKPSLLALNTDLRAINGKWASAELVPAGEYTKKGTTEKKTLTALKFIAVYNSEEECQRASSLFWAYKAVNSDTANTQPATPPAANVNDPNRNTALQFLRPLWGQANGDVNAFAALLAGNPLTSKYFTVSSPEAISIIQGN
jgi:hypothetical protein